MKIVITGATGFVGTRLVKKLSQLGHEILIFSRNIERAKRIFPLTSFPTVTIINYVPTQSGSWQEKLSGYDAVINLAGEPIAEHKWTPEQKKILLESREIGTAKIVEAIANADDQPKVLINASAIGYYGTSETKTFDENSPSGNDFLAEICQKWENSAKKVEELSVRLVIFRFGIILGNGGALAKMIPPFRLFAGGPIGSGKQWFSWIHREDVVDLLILALNRADIQGIFNATAPSPVRMNTLCDVLGKVMGRPSWLPVPDFALQLLLGDGAKVVLEGQEVLPKATQALGYEFKFSQIEPALRDIINS